MIVEACPARAALAGNPSDGFGGAVVSVPIRSVSATVGLTPAPRFDIATVTTDGDTFGSFADIDRHIRRYGYTGGRELLLASIRRFARHTGLEPSPCLLTMTTTIPRSVGLAGSSAIIIASLRTLYHHTDLTAPHADELASLALAVEVDELGHAAGLQDRVVQAHGQAMFMRFAEADRRIVGGLVAGTYETIDRPLPGDVFVACREVDAEPSQRVHGDLRRRFDDGDRNVRSTMADLAGLAVQAAEAISHGDPAGLGQAIDGSFDRRRSIVDLRAGHIEMIDIARRAGAHANFAGSGGAIVVFASESRVCEDARAALAATGCTIIPLDSGPAPPPFA